MQLWGRREGGAGFGMPGWHKHPTGRETQGTTSLCHLACPGCLVVLGLLPVGLLGRFLCPGSPGEAPQMLHSCGWHSWSCGDMALSCGSAGSLSLGACWALPVDLIPRSGLGLGCRSAPTGSNRSQVIPASLQASPFPLHATHCCRCHLPGSPAASLTLCSSLPGC